MQRLNPVWKDEVQSKISTFLLYPDQHVEYTLTYKFAVQYVILQLNKKEIPYKIYNLGAGVTKIITNTTTCPCCKKKL